MARSRRSTTPATPQMANLSMAQIRAAITRLERRISELEALPIAEIESGSDPRVRELEDAINNTLAAIFGAASLEYENLKGRFDVTIHYGGNQGHIDQERQQAIALLRRQIGLIKEQLGEDPDSEADRAIRAYSNLDLHTDIAHTA